MQNSLRQNSQYTFKHNISMGRHSWLRLTPAYSVKIVEEILADLGYTPQCVLEPFSGTGTTELVCANMGINSLALEINPFLVWLAETKTAVYSEVEIANFNKVASDIVDNLDFVEPASLPPLYNIERWWGPAQLNFLARLKCAIWAECDCQIKNLLKIVFCKTLIELSNASFNHVSTSFKEYTEENYETEYGGQYFLSVCNMISKTAKTQPKVEPVVINHDARTVPLNLHGIYDTVITSPPYPNRISYIRELRPYMYWLDFLNTSEQASEMDWNTIGGTWGSATSKLSTWECSTNQLPSYLFKIINNIACADNKSAQLMANYVLKYFDDMMSHFMSIFSGLMSGGKVNYIVGNSNFYGVAVPSEKLYADIMTKVGFHDVSHQIVRKRNCNKALYEYLITATK